MKLIIDKKIFEEFQSVKLGVVIGLGVDNVGSKPEINELLKEWSENRKTEFSNTSITEHERIKPWREAYSKFGAKPSKYNSSIESLLKRVSSGSNLPNINPIVDLYNAMSLKHLMPYGAEDLDRVKGDIRLAIAEGTEAGRYIGGKEIETCERGEVAYLDDLGFICRRWNWRESDRTKLTGESKNLILVIEALPPAGEHELKEAVGDFVKNAKEDLGGDYSTSILSGENPEFEVDFKTGQKLTDGDIEELKIRKTLKARKVDVLGKSDSEEAGKKEYTGIAKKINEAIKKVIGIDDIHLETPENEEFGDYSSNVAMQAFSQKKEQSTKGKDSKSPHELAEKITEKLKQDKELQKVVDKIEVAGAGFINFWLKKGVLVNELREIISTADNYSKTDTLKDRKICVEYTDPNPFKEFHIGHLISNLTGESLSNIFEANGAIVWRADYFGNVGMHVAKSLWGMMQKMKEENVGLEDLEKKSIPERQEFMGKGYAYGTLKYEENDEVKEAVKDINYMVYIAAQEIYQEEKGWQPIIDYKKYVYGDMSNYQEIKRVYKSGLHWSLEYFETIYKRLGTKFDGYYPESVVGEVGYQLVKDNVGKVFKESDGAIIFEGEKYRLHTRVFINKLGLPTYEAKELGLAPVKYKDFSYDKSIMVVGKEIKEYFAVLIEALKQINPKLGNITEPICTGMITVPSGKMGSRFGNVVTVNSLLDHLKKLIEEKYLNKDYLEEYGEDVSEKVAQGALKYAFLKNSVGSDFIFDMNASVSLEGNSGPYIQYTYARTQSVLRKGQRTKDKDQRTEFKKVEFNKEELSLLRTFVRFSDVISMSAKNYSPNLLCNYLYDLASKFNYFYNMHDILEQRTKNKEQTEFRLALTAATGQILKTGLNLLGIQTPEKM